MLIDVASDGLVSRSPMAVWLSTCHGRRAYALYAAGVSMTHRMFHVKQDPSRLTFLAVSVDIRHLPRSAKRSAACSVDASSPAPAPGMSHDQPCPTWLVRISLYHSLRHSHGPSGFLGPTLILRRGGLRVVAAPARAPSSRTATSPVSRETPPTPSPSRTDRLQHAAERRASHSATKCTKP